MEIFIYQIVIASIIIISGYSGKKAKNTATIIIALFTVTHIFMPWLMILQFITIAISFSIASSIAEKKEEQKRKKMLSSSNSSLGCTGIFSILFLIVIAIIVLFGFLGFFGEITGWFDTADWF